MRSDSGKPAARRAGRTMSCRNLSRLSGGPVGRTNKKSSRSTPLRRPAARSGEYGSQVVAKPCRDGDVAITGVGLRGATRECVRQAGEAMDRKQGLGDPDAPASEVDAADREPAQLGGAHTGIGEEPNRWLVQAPDVSHETLDVGHVRSVARPEFALEDPDLVAGCRVVPAGIGT